MYRLYGCVDDTEIEFLETPVFGKIKNFRITC